MIDEVKIALRVVNNAYDTEVQSLIEEAKHYLLLLGVSPTKINDESDPLIKKAVKTYCKANFGFDNQDAERLEEAYENIKQFLMLSGYYKDTGDTL